MSNRCLRFAILPSFTSSSGRAKTTRLAPSPTGALHLGNALTFLINWTLAKQRSWKVVLRIDDLEGPRVKPSADVQAIEDLQWLGLDWTGEPLYQSSRSALYDAALDRLARRGLLFDCRCSRKQVEAESTRYAQDGAAIYAGRCRGGREGLTTDAAASRRFRAPPKRVDFVDDFVGPQAFDAEHDLGDFIVRKADGEYGYHLATVVDDAQTGVTHVVRGQDLLASTPRQILLYEALELERRIPSYIHLPLVVGRDGRKLAKRHGDTRLRQLREGGVTAGQVRRLLAGWANLPDAGDGDVTVQQWVDGFDLARLPPGPFVYDDQTDRPRPR